MLSKSHGLQNRIKRIMQSNDDVGKVAAASTHLVVCAIEEFLDDLVKGAVEKAESRGSKLLSGAHLKSRVMEQPTLDFCKSVVERAADLKDEVGVQAKRSRQRQKKAAKEYNDEEEEEEEEEYDDDDDDDDDDDEQEEEIVEELPKKKPRAKKKKTTRRALPVKQEEEEIVGDKEKIEMEEELKQEIDNTRDYDYKDDAKDVCLEAEEEDYDDL
eukprot:jgi/Picsp_1/4673/NSC_02042-R1_dna polymerase epsilon subunit c